MKIFFYSDNYPERRCIINKVSDFHYSNIRSQFNLFSIVDKLINNISYKFAVYKKEKTLSSYFFLKRKGVIHSFNYCISGGNKWIVTFESITPRTNSTRSVQNCNNHSQGSLDYFTRRGLDHLASPYCLAIIALSECTKTIQLNYLESINHCYNASSIHLISQKMMVLHPPQQLLCSESDIHVKYDRPSDLYFIFVGNDFFRKGGHVVVDVLSKYADSQSFHLTVISDLSFNDYATNSTQNDRDKYADILNNSSWISWHSSISNDKVLDECKKAHIGLLPTFADTYGYSVLEMQAAGCPVITTDIRALPEINNSDCGWLIHLPHNENGEASYSTQDEVLSNYSTVYSQLDTTIRKIFDTPSKELCDKALASYNRIKKHHDPIAYSDKLKEIIRPFTP